MYWYFLLVSPLLKKPLVGEVNPVSHWRKRTEFLSSRTSFTLLRPTLLLPPFALAPPLVSPTGVEKRVDEVVSLFRVDDGLGPVPGRGWETHPSGGGYRVRLPDWTPWSPPTLFYLLPRVYPLLDRLGVPLRSSPTSRTKTSDSLSLSPADPVPLSPREEHGTDGGTVPGDARLCTFQKPSLSSTLGRTGRRPFFELNKFKRVKRDF